MFIRRIAKSIQRASARRRVRYWAEMIEALDRQQRTHPGNLAVALSECAAAKRELAAIDAPPRRVTHAPGPGVRDGAVRFCLIDDAPPAKAPR